MELAAAVPDGLYSSLAVVQVLLILFNQWRLSLMSKLEQQSICVISQQVQILVKQAGQVLSRGLVQTQHLSDSLPG